MASNDMLAWLRSTIEGDKGLAEVAASSERYGVRYTGHWTYTVGDDLVYQDGRRGPGAAGIVGRSCDCCGPASVGHPHDLMHIATHDPRDTIARCDAELKLLDLHGPNRYGYCLTCGPDSCGCVGSGSYPCDTLLTVLAGYRHREGFNRVSG